MRAPCCAANRTRTAVSAMLDVDAAQSLVLAGLTPNPAESLAPRAALGRVLAGALRSQQDLPPFDNAAMDGFALPLGTRTADAGEVFTVEGEQAAGDGARPARCACAIMTGARLPDGLDAVVPVEQVQVLERDAQGRVQRIRLDAAVQPAQHVRRRGEDVRRGEPALPAGCRIGPSQLALLTGIGRAAVEVIRAPTLTLLCTGRELVDEATRPLRSGEIHNSNGPYLAAAARAAGAALQREATLPDDPAALRRAIGQAQEAGSQLVLSTGAVSAGRYDFVPQVLQSLGAEIVFHKVRMRPGKPLLFARLAGGALYFGLPGNPVSAAVGFRFFVCPALRALLGLPPERPWRAPLLHAVSRKPGFTLFQKARVALDENGVAGVRLLQGQESFRVAPLAQANGWAVVPADAGALSTGALVDVHGTDHWCLRLEPETPA